MGRTAHMWVEVGIDKEGKVRVAANYEGFKLNCLVENREMDVESSSSSSLVDDASLSLSGMCCVSWADTRYIWFLLCVIANSFCLQKRI